MSRLGIDYAWHGKIDATAIRRAGATFVARYLSHDPGKNLARAEAETLAKAGLDVVVVWETTANRAAAGHAAGVADAREADRQARACGMPDGRPIYFAVDWDARPGQVLAYFQGAAAVLGRARVGVYAGIDVVAYLLGHRVVAYAWQTYAWSENRRDPRAQLYQFHNGVRVAGIDSDWDRAYATDFGQWRIGASVDPLTPRERRQVDRLAHERRTAHAHGWTDERRGDADRIKHWLIAQRARITAVAARDGWNHANRRARYVLLGRAWRGETV